MIQAFNQLIKPQLQQISESSSSESTSDSEISDEQLMTAAYINRLAAQSNDSVTDQEAEELSAMMQQAIQIDRKHPIILIHGLAGSRFISVNKKTQEQSQIWIPPNLDFKTNTDIIVNNLWGKMDDDGWYRSFNCDYANLIPIEGISGCYKVFDHPVTDSPLLKSKHIGTYFDVLFDYLVSAGYTPGRNLFAFTYDWRQNLIHDNLLFGLQEIISIALLKNPGMKCNLIAHSMGGHIVMNYIKKTPDYWNYIRRFIALTVPFDGSSAYLYMATLRGYNLQSPFHPLMGRALGSSIPSMGMLYPNPYIKGGQVSQVFVQKYQRQQTFSQKQFKNLKTSNKEVVLQEIRSNQAFTVQGVPVQFESSQHSFTPQYENQLIQWAENAVEGAKQEKTDKKELERPLPYIKNRVVEVILNQEIYEDEIPDVSFLILKKILKNPSQLQFDRSETIMKLRNGCKKGSVMVIKKTNKRLKIMKQKSWHLEKIFEQKPINLKNKSLPVEWQQFNLWQPYETDDVNFQLTRSYTNSNSQVLFLKGVPILKNKMVQQSIDAGFFAQDIIQTESNDMFNMACQYQILLEQREFARVNEAYETQITHNLDFSQPLFKLFNDMNREGTFERICFFPDLKMFQIRQQAAVELLDMSAVLGDPKQNISMASSTDQSHLSQASPKISNKLLLEESSCEQNNEEIAERIMDTFKFYNYCGCGVPTPLHMIFKQPVYDYSDLNYQQPDFLWADGDGTVLLPNALNDGFPKELVAERVAFTGVKHANIMKTPRVIERIMSALK